MHHQMNESDFMGRWSLLHGNAQPIGIVKGWLRISYRCALILKKSRISANALTAFGVIFAGATAMASPSILAGLFLAISLALDGVDGSVALLTGKESKLGAIFDSSADRISEALWAVAFYRLGVSLPLILLLWLLAAIQEYARARLGSAGVKEVGVITPAERPVRASFLFVAIIAFHLEFSNGWVTAISECLIFLQGISLFLVLKYAFRSLK